VRYDDDVRVCKTAGISTIRESREVRESRSQGVKKSRSHGFPGVHAHSLEVQNICLRRDSTSNRFSGFLSFLWLRVLPILTFLYLIIRLLLAAEFKRGDDHGIRFDTAPATHAPSS
jgi:hypothetical protein